MSQVIISIPENEFWDKMGNLMDARIEASKPPPAKNLETYTINQARKLMKRGYATIVKLINAGALKTLDDGRIPHSEIVKYLERYNN